MPDSTAQRVAASRAACHLGNNPSHPLCVQCKKPQYCIHFDEKTCKVSCVFGQPVASRPDVNPRPSALNPTHPPLQCIKCDKGCKLERDGTCKVRIARAGRMLEIAHAAAPLAMHGCRLSCLCLATTPPCRRSAGTPTSRCAGALACPCAGLPYAHALLRSSRSTLTSPEHPAPHLPHP